MSKYSRSGGKYTSSHTTLIEAAAIVCDVADRCPSVTKISIGFIRTGLKPVNGQRRVKIMDGEGGILLSIRDNTSNQEVRVYGGDVGAAKLAIARGARSAGLNISFGGE